MKTLGHIIVMLVVLWIGCMALNLMDAHGMITPAPVSAPAK